MNPEQPLGLPSGSVTALIALGCVGAVLGIAVTGGVIPDYLKEITGLAVAYFFGHNVGTASSSASATAIRTLMTTPPSTTTATVTGENPVVLMPTTEAPATPTGGR